MNDDLTVKTEHLKTLNNIWMNIPHKKRPKKEDIEYLQILIIKYAMNIIETGYTTWERFNKSSNTYNYILNLMSSHNYVVTYDEARRQHIEQENIDMRWPYCIQNFLIELIYEEIPLEKDFLPFGFQYNNQHDNNQHDLNITENFNNSIINAQVSEFIFNKVLTKKVDKKNYEKLALDIKK
ncbi:MAG: hypothetical protein ACMZI0_02780 [Symbiopectobacterium sp.]|uniref:hypothetical protein n=1 Tax=Symbiopectobacterium sp. TaxID=2952789 RepID=UPI0039E7685B